MVVFKEGDAIHHSKILSFFRKEPFELEACYQDPKNVPYLNPIIGECNTRATLKLKGLPLICISISSLTTCYCIEDDVMWLPHSYLMVWLSFFEFLRRPASPVYVG